MSSHAAAPTIVTRRSLFYLVALAVLTCFSILTYLGHAPASRTLTNWTHTLDHFQPPSAPDMPLTDFLRTVKSAALSGVAGADAARQSPDIVLIMGNEAGDLDSLASAVALSYLLTTYPHPSLPSSPSTIYAPLIQTNRADLYLRQENGAALNASGIDAEDLLMLNDLTSAGDLATSPNLSPSNGVSLGLVDHPSLAIPWGGPNVSSTDRKVLLVVDHHADEQAHLDAPLRVIRGPPGPDAVGSASSLITSLFAANISQGPHKLPRELADLLIAAITLDTSNLRPSPRGKGSTTDVAAVELLLPFSSFAGGISPSPDMLSLLSTPPSLAPAPASPASEETQRPPHAAHTHPYYTALSTLKDAVSHLSTRDLLRRDYKEVLAPLSSSEDASLRAGFASVPLGLSTWLHKQRPAFAAGALPDGVLRADEAAADWDAWWDANRSWMRERELALSVLLLSSREQRDGEVRPKHRRVLVLLFRPPPHLRDRAPALWQALTQALERDAHAAPADLPARMLLEQPWKGVRLRDHADKRERVAGLRADATLRGAGEQVWAAVYRQGNNKANRKIVLPAVLHALKQIR